MALYQGLSSGPAAGRRDDAPIPQRPSQAQAWRRLQVSVDEDEAEAEATFMDRLLGAGSAQTLGRAVGGAIAGLRGRKAAKRAPAPKAAPKSWTPQRMQAVGAGAEALPRGHKGVGRVILALVVLGFAAVLLKPLQRLAELREDAAALFSAPPPAAAERQKATQRQKAQSDAARVAGLPLDTSLGKPLALWQDSSGRWWQADADGALAPSAPPSAKENLGLPEVRGLQAANEERRGSRRLRLVLDKVSLGALLPLDASVASETRALLFDESGQPVLLTHEGTRCLLGGEDWARREKRLALVLADLAARRRRVSQIDLRYDDTAVVRPAGR